MPNLILPKYRMLFHFTAEHLIERIKMEGLWRGRLPWQRDPAGNACCIRHFSETRMTLRQIEDLDAREAREYEENLARKKAAIEKGTKPLTPRRMNRRPGFQWLTTNGEWHQPFCLLGTLPYPKNAYRVKILVPESAFQRLFRWSGMCDRGQPDCREEMNTVAVDWENWWVFYGPIPPSWMIETPLRNPGPQLMPTQLNGRESAG